MKLNYVLFFVGLWKLKENSKNYIVNMLNTGKFCAFEEHNTNNVVKGYWEEKNDELIISTNESKIYKAFCKNLTSDKIQGYVGYGLDYPDYLYDFELIPIYRNKTTKYPPVRVLKSTSSFEGRWLLERPALTSYNSIKKIKVKNKRIYTKINNEKMYNFPIINLIKLNNNGTWYYGTSQGHLHLAGKWNVYNYTFPEDEVNYNKAFVKNSSGENIWLRKNDGSIFMGSFIFANNTKINGTSIEGEIEPDYVSNFYICRWFAN